MRKTKNLRTKFIGTFLGVCMAMNGSGGVFAEMKTEPLNQLSDTKELERFADEFMAEQQNTDLAVPGAAIVVVKDDKVLLEKGYGYADKERQIPVDPRKTVFRIGSVTKTFTAAAVMQLVEQGKIDLHVDINKYLEEGIRIRNPFDQPVTMHHLLTHSTGFDVTIETMDDFHDDLTKFVSLSDYVKQRMPDVVRKPGESYMYDNFAFVLQGYIIERVTGIPFHQYMKQNLFQPLDMLNTDLLLTDEVLSHLAKAYVGGQALDPYALTPTESPDGGMNATASDIGKFMISQLQDGVYQNKRIWSKESIRQMHQYHVAIHPRVEDATYGYEGAFEPEHNNGQKVITKGGDLIGFSSYMWLIPEQKVGVFFTCNTSSDLRSAWFIAFMDRYFPSTDASPKPVPLNTPQEQLRRFEGEYSDARISVALTTITAIGDGELLVESLMGKQKVKQIEPLLFKDETGKLMAFKENSDQSISYFKYMNPVSYSQKITTPKYQDVLAISEYAPYIRHLQLIGILKGNHENFEPTRAMTRAEATALIIRILGVQLSQEPVKFKDTAGNWAAAQIQTAVQLGIVEGRTDDAFSPEDPVTRQEAALMIARAFKEQFANYPAELRTDDIELSGPTDEWALEAVKTMVALGLHGPEVAPSKVGTVDYHSRRELTREEAAALFSTTINKLILQR